MASASRFKIGMWASPEKKAKFAALAAARGMTETALLAVLVDHVLDSNPEPAAPAVADDEEGASTDRLTLRLRPGDRPLVEARAAKRGMKASSYLVALIRAHVRGSAPLPTTELNLLKAAVGELSAVGRNLNQVARSVNSGAGAAALGGLAETVDEAFDWVESLRRSVADLVRVNMMSWEGGDA